MLTDVMSIPLFFPLVLNSSTTIFPNLNFLKNLTPTSGAVIFYGIGQHPRCICKSGFSGLDQCVLANQRAWLSPKDPCHFKV